MLEEKKNVFVYVELCIFFFIYLGEGYVVLVIYLIKCIFFYEDVIDNLVDLIIEFFLFNFLG